MHAKHIHSQKESGETKCHRQADVAEGLPQSYQTDDTTNHLSYCGAKNE